MMTSLLKMKITIKTLALLYLFSLNSCINLKSEEPLEEWGVYEFIYNGEDQFKIAKKNIVYSALELYFNKRENKIFFEISEENKVTGDFSTEQLESNLFFLNIENSNDKRFNDKFLMKIDTIKKSKSSTELRLIIESEKLYLLGKRTIFELKIKS